MRILGIDYGESRIGLAISDMMGLMAQGLYTINTKENKDFLEEIANIIKKNNVTKVVVGLPKNMDGTIGFRGKATMDFMETLKNHIKVEILAWDERLTTVSANKVLNEINIRGKKRKKILDTVAATYILQNYLDSII